MTTPYWSDFVLNSTFYRILSGFHRTFATGVACRQGTLTPPDTWSCPFGTCICSTCWDQSFSELVVILPDYALRISLGTFSILLLPLQTNLYPNAIRLRKCFSHWREIYTQNVHIWGNVFSEWRQISRLGKCYLPLETDLYPKWVCLGKCFLSLWTDILPKFTCLGKCFLLLETDFYPKFTPLGKCFRLLETDLYLKFTRLGNCFSPTGGRSIPEIYTFWEIFSSTGDRSIPKIYAWFTGVLHREVVMQ